LFFSYPDCNALKEAAEAGRGYSDFFQSITDKINKVQYYVHTHERIHEDTKKEIFTIIEEIITKSPNPPTIRELNYIADSIFSSIHKLLLPYFEERINQILSTVPELANGNKGGDAFVWGLIVATVWLEKVLEDIGKQGEFARELEPFLEMTIQRYGIDRFGFIALENNEKMKLVESAEKLREENRLKKDAANKRDKIIWLKSVDALRDLIRILYDAGFLNSYDEEKIFPHFFFKIDSGANIKRSSSHKIKLVGKHKNILFIFIKLIEKKFIQGLTLSKNTKHDSSAANIISQHFKNGKNEPYDFNSLRTDLNKIYNEKVKADDEVYSKVISKINKIS